MPLSQFISEHLPGFSKENLDQFGKYLNEGDEQQMESDHSNETELIDLYSDDEI